MALISGFASHSRAQRAKGHRRIDFHVSKFAGEERANTIVRIFHVKNALFLDLENARLVPRSRNSAFVSKRTISHYLDKSFTCVFGGTCPKNA
jgi:hypothetical protein